MKSLKYRLSAAGYHLLLTGFVAGGAAYLVFFLWYPEPFNITSGGDDLFSILLSVDLVLGPFLTFTIFSREKPRSVLFKDLFVVASLQLAALLYGLSVMYGSRPVYLVHEVDRVQVVTAADIDEYDLKNALPEFQKLPFFGVRLVGVRAPMNGEEKLKSIEQAMAGRDIAMRPDWWRPIDANYRSSMEVRGLSMGEIKARNPDAMAKIDPLLKEGAADQSEVLLFPLMARAPDWSVLLDRKTWKIVGFVPVDGF